MSHGITLKVWGEYACFTRPEMKVERVSYDVLTPSAARGILDAIHWKPAISWVVDRVHVLNPIRFQTIRRNEVGSKISERVARTAMARGDLSGLHLVVDEDRQQRATVALRDVAYVIEAHFVLTKKAEADDTPAKHLSMALRRAEKGQCFHRPCLGVREFAADFELVTGPIPKTSIPEGERTRDLGWMLYDIDYADGMTAKFFRAQMTDGVIDLTGVRPEGLAS
ncbi:MAG: type I-C CRISPR-associated protein Cas5 [Rhodospirillaceae bacterium]|nr:type I-C CRISPR-associated protein Cas5 [Rhodospirillaceae bacterium]